MGNRKKRGKKRGRKRKYNRNKEKLKERVIYCGTHQQSTYLCCNSSIPILLKLENWLIFFSYARLTEMKSQLAVSLNLN